MKRLIACLALFTAGLLASACAGGPRPQLHNPHETVGAMRLAWEKDNVGLFLHTLGRPVLKEYSEQRLRIGWSSIRPLVGDFVVGAAIVESDVYILPARDSFTGSGWIWPEPGMPLRRLRLSADGLEEDFLFGMEVDEPPAQSIQSRGFYIGDTWHVVSAHHSPQTYLFIDSPESERTHWRLLFPFQPFQQDGPLTQRLLERMGSE